MPKIVRTMRILVQGQEPTEQATFVSSKTHTGEISAQYPDLHSILHLQRTIGNKAVLQLLTSQTTSHISNRLPTVSKSPRTIRTQLLVNTPGDAYEQEAERVSDAVMRIPAPQLQRACACGGECPDCQAKHPEREPERLQTKSVEASNAGEDVAPPIVEEVLRSSGQPLDPITRAFFEPRFGHSFDQVRVHTDAPANQSASAVNAHAYTAGHQIVFGAGQYAPATSDGARLIAHELTHVVQQSNPTGFHNLSAETFDRDEVIRRAPDAGSADGPSPAKGAPAAARTDVVLLGIDSATDLAWSKTIAPNAVIKKVKNADDMAAALKSIMAPIGTLFIVLHGQPDGDLGFETGGTTTFFLPSVVAGKLKGAVSPENAPTLVDFRGCNIGTSPKAMDQMRASLGAGGARGANCFVVVRTQGPITLEGQAITTPAQAKKDPDVFDQGLKKLINSFGQAQACILDRSPEAYFRAGGALVAEWVNPEESTSWDERYSKCFASLKPEAADPTKGREAYEPGLAGDCRLLTIREQHGRTP